MDEYYCKRSGQIHVQIPAFGDWDNTNQLPITQYFECARQAGLIRYSSSSGECGTYANGTTDLYAVDHNKHTRTRRTAPPHPHPHQPSKTRAREKRHPNGKDQIKKQQQKQQGRVFDVTEPPRKHNNDYVVPPPRPDHRPHRRPVKPVDEDLYKIPPDQLRHMTSKKNKMRGLLSKCLVPACNS